MSKTRKIIYWIITLWLGLGMTSTGIVQILKLKEKEPFVVNLGYPDYFFVIIGVWKLLGVVAVLIPKFPLLKEWAYAGFFFVMTGAILSHFAAGTVNQIFPSLLLLALVIASYFLRPADRRVILKN